MTDSADVKLARLEEAIRSHCESSNDFRNDVKNSLAINQSEIQDVKRQLQSYMLGGADRKEGCYRQAKAYTDAALRWSIGVPAFVLVVLKLIDMFHK